jgi:hypothetical protein
MACNIEDEHDVEAGIEEDSAEWKDVECDVELVLGTDSVEGIEGQRAEFAYTKQLLLTKLGQNTSKRAIWEFVLKPDSHVVMELRRVLGETDANTGQISVMSYDKLLKFIHSVNVMCALRMSLTDFERFDLCDRLSLRVEEMRMYFRTLNELENVNIIQLFDSFSITCARLLSGWHGVLSVDDLKNIVDIRRPGHTLQSANVKGTYYSKNHRRGTDTYCAATPLTGILLSAVPDERGKPKAYLVGKALTQAFAISNKDRDEKKNHCVVAAYVLTADFLILQTPLRWLTLEVRCIAPLKIMRGTPLCPARVIIQKRGVK